MAEQVQQTAQIMWQGRYITAIREGQWEYVNRANGIGAAVILAIDDADGDPVVVLVEEYRTALHRRCLGLPAGLVGDEAVSHSGPMASGDDAMLAAAKRELLEETGYIAGTWRNAGDYYSSPGMVGESFTLFIARDMERAGNGGGVDGENITVHRVPLSHMAAFIAERRAAGVAIDVRITMLLAPDWLAPERPEPE